ncbi:hypothetical protein GCM10010359_50760 [Streptomyces morookaense]|nr:hypothetical protein GCM10010359_50760 [Streptomyces morookaense]
MLPVSRANAARLVGRWFVTQEAVMERLLAIDWADYAAGDRNAASRALLMREYLRRAAV